jgi:hypothetical protein
MQDADARTDVIKAGAVCIIANDAANHDCAEHNSQDRHQGGIVRWRFAVDFGSHRHGDVFGQLHQANVADCPAVTADLLVANPAGTPGMVRNLLLQSFAAPPRTAAETAQGALDRGSPGRYGSAPKTRGGADVGHVGGRGGILGPRTSDRARPGRPRRIKWRRAQSRMEEASKRAPHVAGLKKGSTGICIRSLGPSRR